METKALLYGLIGFFLGGLLVSVAATTFDKPVDDTTDVSMSQMTETLASKKGDEFDEAFISRMIEHHEGAVEMARLSVTNAKHDEIKKLSQNIISSQMTEITEMKQWQTAWGYKESTETHGASHKVE